MAWRSHWFSCSQANAPAASRSPRAPSRRRFSCTASRRRRSTRRRPNTSPSKRRWQRYASLVSSPRTSRRRRMSGGTRRGCTSAPGSGPRSSPRGTRRSSTCFSRGLIAHIYQAKLRIQVCDRRPEECTAVLASRTHGGVRRRRGRRSGGQCARVGTLQVSSVRESLEALAFHPACTTACPPLIIPSDSRAARHLAAENRKVVILDL